MNQAYWRRLMTTAYDNDDTEQIDAMAQRLADSEEAMSILRAKGYGSSGQTIVMMARLVASERE